MILSAIARNRDTIARSLAKKGRWGFEFGEVADAFLAQGLSNAAIGAATGGAMALMSGGSLTSGIMQGAFIGASHGTISNMSRNRAAMARSVGIDPGRGFLSGFRATGMVNQRFASTGSAAFLDTGTATARQQARQHALDFAKVRRELRSGSLSGQARAEAMDRLNQAAENLSAFGGSAANVDAIRSRLNRQIRALSGM